MQKGGKTMAERTKRIFISDIHMGDDRSMLATPNPYVWFRKNIDLLALFLKEQLNSPDAKEVVILGDLFDTWVIPTDDNPLTSFEKICSNEVNKPVIEALKALAASSEVKLIYVPGNHDMAMNSAGIPAIKQFMEKKFPGIQYCDSPAPWGAYMDGVLTAEHGNRYGLFNTQDTWTKPDCFLPLGYFISRVIACKVNNTAHGQDPHDIFVYFLKLYKHFAKFAEYLFLAIAKDAGLDPNKDHIDLSGIPGYLPSMTIGDIGNLFKDLFQNWKDAPGHEHVNFAFAIEGDTGELWNAATETYFRPHSETEIVICGHTHRPILGPLYDTGAPTRNVTIKPTTPCRAIYANCGTWMDDSQYGCTYVETQEDPQKGHHYVRVKKYPGNTIYNGYEAYIET
jgi:UDP-2,3-diacylglucosamine pyrophosphatase LpxH